MNEFIAYLLDGKDALDPVTIEEYFNPDGSPNITYFGLTSGTKVSPSALKLALFGAVGETYHHSTAENEVTFKEFKEVYTFGEHENVRGWIRVLYNTKGKLLTRKKLFEFIKLLD